MFAPVFPIEEMKELIPTSQLKEQAMQRDLNSVQQNTRSLLVRSSHYLDPVHAVDKKAQPSGRDPYRSPHDPSSADEAYGDKESSFSEGFTASSIQEQRFSEKFRTRS